MSVSFYGLVAFTRAFYPALKAPNQSRVHKNFGTKGIEGSGTLRSLMKSQICKDTRAKVSIALTSI